MIVDDSINLDKVAEQITQARYGLNCGQVCTAPEYVIYVPTILKFDLNQKLKVFLDIVSLKYMLQLLYYFDLDLNYLGHLYGSKHQRIHN